ncbi:hypothetical protein CgunFtcFv8_013763 [Champsocephalus gunnari]|uniref:Uncharacterized protein n=1 Tax=Champsocephalus gunnari TaxID=52237 RepID=A0AAN8E4P2_CHAGU|nr:hypothetical protein CgunFtcFv8_013763 [Champsocephalus gunnari]
MQKGISTRDLTFQGQRIQIFRDLPTEVVKRRAAFTPTRRTRLRASHNGSERFFADPEEARQYAQRLFGSAEEE